jgi:hypothetical protein
MTEDRNYTYGQGPSRGEPAKRFWRLSFIILALIFGLLLIGLVVRYVLIRNALAEEAFLEASNEAITAAEQLEEDFAVAGALTQDLARDLSDGSLAYRDIQMRLEEMLAQHSDLDGITVAFERGVFGAGDDLYLVYVWRDEFGELQSQTGESRYDYTLPPSDEAQAPQTQWYYDPINSGPTWTEPFLAEGAERVLIEYGAPFYAPNAGREEPIGVVAIDYSLEGMRNLVANLDLGLTGFAAVYAQSGTWLSHPVPERVVQGNIFDDETLQDDNFQDAALRALDGDTLSTQRQANEETVWNFFTPIANTDWALVVQLSETEFLLGREALLRNQVAIVLAGGLFLFFLAGVLLHFDEGSRDRLWLASITFSLIGLVMIIAIIVLARNMPVSLGEGVLVTSQASLRRYQHQLSETYLERGLKQPIDIPTGILIQSARFPEPSVVTLNGYLWQRVPKISGTELAPGISLPQLTDEPVMIDEVYVEERESETLHIWTMTAAIRQAFDPVQYPLDRYDIDVRLAPLEFADNALLVPDLGAYNVTAPSQLPGLDDTVRINNWQIIASAFGLSFRDYGTDFTISQRPTIDVPELTFNIRVERRFLGPFIAFFLPAVVATIMIFGFLLNDQKPDEPEEIVTALSYTAALFFVVAVLHSALRDNAAAIGLTYLEYFYLLLYVLTLLVAVNSFLVVRYPFLPIVRIGDNLISKILFWPTVVGFMLFVTVYVFVLAR